MAGTEGATPSQTVGPFFGYALPYHRDNEIVPPWREGAITVHGTVFDGEGTAVPDALLEVWQADGTGRLPLEPGSLARDGESFTGFGRAATDADGHYRFRTVVPGSAGSEDRTDGSYDHAGAPYLALAVFARGLLDHLYTRVYFPEHQQAHATDPLLSTLQPDRRDTLVAVAEPGARYRFDVYLQGERETVFLALT